MHNMTLLGKLPAILLAMAAAIGSGTTISAGSADGIAADGADASSEGSGAPEEWTGNFSISLSSKNLDRGEWGPSRNQSELGFEVTWGRTHWPLLIATDFLVSNDRQVESAEGDPFTTVTVREALAETSEIALGARKVWGKKRFRFSLGGGVAFILAELNGAAVGLDPSRMEDDIGTGWWLGAGAFLRIGPHWGLGLTARRSAASVDLFGEARDAGGTHGGFTLGWNWPAAL